MMDETSTFPLAQTFIRTGHSFYLTSEIMIFKYVSSCLASDNKLWNFATDSASDMLFVCVAEATCRLNSTLYIPYVDNICVDFRRHTYTVVANAYTNPLAMADPTTAKYWYPVTVGLVTRYKLDSPSSVETCSLSSSSTNPLFASTNVITA